MKLEITSKKNTKTGALDYSVTDVATGEPAGKIESIEIVGNVESFHAVIDTEKAKK